MAATGARIRVPVAVACRVLKFSRQAVAPRAVQPARLGRRARGQRWPLHQPPRPGERLTSWLYQIAADYRLTLGELLEHDLGHRPGATGVLDVDPPAELVTTIARRSGLDHDRVRRMSVAGHVPWLLDSLDPQTGGFDVYVRQLSILVPASWRCSGGRRRPGPAVRPRLPQHRPNCGPARAAPPARTAGSDAHARATAPAGPHDAPLPSRTLLRAPRSPALAHSKPPAATGAGCDGHSRRLHRSGDERRAGAAASLHGGMWFRLLRTLIDELCAPIDGTGPVVREIWARHGGGPPRIIYRPFETLRRPDQIELLTVAADTIAQLLACEITPR